MCKGGDFLARGEGEQAIFGKSRGGQAVFGM